MKKLKNNIVVHIVHKDKSKMGPHRTDVVRGQVSLLHYRPNIFIIGAVFYRECESLKLYIIFTSITSTRRAVTQAFIYKQMYNMLIANILIELYTAGNILPLYVRWILVTERKKQK